MLKTSKKCVALFQDNTHNLPFFSLSKFGNPSSEMKYERCFLIKIPLFHDKKGGTFTIYDEEDMLIFYNFFNNGQALLHACFQLLLEYLRFNGLFDKTRRISCIKFFE